MMNKKSEISVYILFFLVAGFIIVGESGQSPFYFYYSLVLWLSTGFILSITRYFIAPRIRAGKALQGFFFLTVLLNTAFFITAYFYGRYLEAIIADYTFSWLEPVLLREVLPWLPIAAVSGFVHIINLQSTLFKKTAKVTSVIMLTIMLGFTGNYIIDSTYNGNESIRFLNGNFNNLEAILGQQQFQNKIIYIDLWFSSCGPCIKEFQKLPEIKKRLAETNIEYLYLARETSHPNSLQLWKNAVREYDLTGWHVYMSKELQENMWRIIKQRTTNKYGTYPHYLLVDTTNDSIIYDSKRPTDGELLIEEIENFSKLLVLDKK